MPDDYFSDLASPTTAQEPAREREPSTKKDESREEQTGLLAKSFFMGKDLDVDKKCEIRIVRIYDDEVEVEYVPHKKDGKKKSQKEESEDSMSAYAS